MINANTFVPYWCIKCNTTIDVPYIETIMDGSIYCPDCGTGLTIIPAYTFDRRNADRIDGYDRDDLPDQDPFDPFDEVLGG